MKFDENIEVECVTCTGTRTSSKSQSLKYLAEHKIRNYAWNCCGGKQFLSKIQFDRVIELN